MEKDIEEIIQKNLPAQVGTVLKNRLEQAEKDAEEVKQQKAYLEERSKEIQAFRVLIEDYKKFDERNLKLEEREKMVTEVERNLKIRELEFQLISEKEKTEFSKSVALGLVRNIEYRKNIFDSENQNSYQDSHGNYVYPTPINKSLNEDKTAL